jgi:hypothetical protein
MPTEKIRLYNDSCPPLEKLLDRLRHVKAPASIWHRATIGVVQRLAKTLKVTLAELVE